LSSLLHIPLIKNLIPDGISYGTVLMVEFEPGSCWYDMAFTMVAEAVGNRIKTDLHLFQRKPQEAKAALIRLGLEVDRLLGEDQLRIIDSYTIQTGVGTAERPKGSDAFKTASVKLSDWSVAAKAQLTQGISEAEKKRLHIDDNLTVMTRYNGEDEVIDYWRTSIIPLYRARESVLINAVSTGVASDSFYRKFESLCDGIIDCRTREEAGEVEQYIRLRSMSGRGHDSHWQHATITENGRVRLDPDRRRVQELDSEVAKKRGLQTGQPGEPTQESGRSLAAIMFTDIVGYTTLAQRDEGHALRLLEDHRRSLRAIFPKYSGREIKTIGDSFLVEFPSALEAARCAIEIQRKTHLPEKTNLEDRVALRIGLHLGDLVHTADGDIQGDAVNVASRIEPLADPGGICISDQVYAQIKNKIDNPIVKLGSRTLKNVEEPMDIYRVVLQ
jgi:class 3 adenylate cyclase